MLSGSFEDDDAFLADDASVDGPRPPKLRKTMTMKVEETTATGQLLQATALRQKYQQEPHISAELREAIACERRLTYRFNPSGLLELLDAESEGAAAVVACCAFDVGTFARDYAALVKIVGDGRCRTFCHQRLEMLQQRFDLHQTEQGDMEMREMGRGAMASVDFFQCGKVDNHVRDRVRIRVGFGSG